VSDNLPPLPETDWLLHMPAQAYEQEWTSSQPGYTADQMRSYAAAAVAAERERCAKLCEQRAGDHWADYKGHGTGPRGGTRSEAASDEADACAMAIRGICA
jgi:hypothetical protein